MSKDKRVPKFEHAMWIPKDESPLHGDSDALPGAPRESPPVHTSAADHPGEVFPSTGAAHERLEHTLVMHPDPLSLTAREPTRLGGDDVSTSGEAAQAAGEGSPGQLGVPFAPGAQGSDPESSQEAEPAETAESDEAMAALAVAEALSEIALFEQNAAKLKDLVSALAMR